MFDCKLLPFIFDKTGDTVKVKTGFKIIQQGWYLNFSAWFVENGSNTWTEKDETMR